MYMLSELKMEVKWAVSIEQTDLSVTDLRRCMESEISDDWNYHFQNAKSWTLLVEL